MEAISEILANIAAAAPALVPILYTLLVAAGLDVLTGLWSAWKSGTLNGQYVAEFVKNHVALKVGPIMLLLIAGVSVGGTDNVAGAGLVAAGGASAAAYLASVVASIKDNLDSASTHTKGLPNGVTTDVVLTPLEPEVGVAQPPA